MIEICSLNKSFNNLQVLKDINLKIENGDIFGIIGHSGAGKSTLLRCINALEAHDSGTLKVVDKDIKALKEKELRVLRKDLGMIFQSFNLLNRKNVYDNIALPLETWKYNKAEVKEKVEELLKLIDLKEKAKVKPSSLSGGQKQRVAIARALALNPKVILCDEATSALDPKTTKDILSLLRKLNETLGITIVLVTHQMEVIKEICNKVAVMEQGEILYSGSVEELFLKPNPILRNLLGEDNHTIPLSGTNIKIFFPSSISNKAIIASMSRELNIDFSIVGGKLEKFRDSVLGSLTLNIEPNKEKIIADYLREKNIEWEVL